MSILRLTVLLGILPFGDFLHNPFHSMRFLLVLGLAGRTLSSGRVVAQRTQAEHVWKDRTVHIRITSRLRSRSASACAIEIDPHQNHCDILSPLMAGFYACTVRTGWRGYAG